MLRSKWFCWDSAFRAQACTKQGVAIMYLFLEQNKVETMRGLNSEFCENPPALNGTELRFRQKIDGYNMPQLS